MSAVFQRIMDNRFISWLLKAKRLPLLYAVTVMTAIMYHFNAAWTPIWIVLIFLMELAVFKLCEFVDKHHLLGGIAFVLAGFATLAVALVFIKIGQEPEIFNNYFLPEGVTRNIDFYIWFLTPQSALNAFYGPYTIALLILFSFFIGFATYYFTFVQYRVLMSFSILCFPFAIYAKEAEDMPILCIIILFACYFAVMLFCRQLHADDPDVIHYYDKDQRSYPMTAVTGTTHTKESPELSDGAGWRSGAVFLCAACIVVLAVPKPVVREDRSYIEGLINMAAFTDFLLNAVNGFEEESDGGTDAVIRTSQVLFYAETDSPVNLRRATLSHYHYDSDSWTAESDFDGKLNVDADTLHKYQTVLNYNDYDLTGEKNTNDGNLFSCEITLPTAYDEYLLLKSVAQASPEFAEKWGLTPLTATNLLPEKYEHDLHMECSTFNGTIYMAPNQTYTLGSTAQVMQNWSKILYRERPERVFRERYSMRYLSDAIAQTPEIQHILHTVSMENCSEMLLDMQPYLTAETAPLWSNMIADYYMAEQYAAAIRENYETPESVQQLAATLTEGCTTDYDKAIAIAKYLVGGEYIYDLDYVRGQGANVETFLFESKHGVCYQFASAMAELCRSAGLITRYVEGYSLQEPDNSITRDSGNYIIRTSHAHAFVEVYLAGYGWFSIDATAPDYSSRVQDDNEGVLATLQFTGIFLLIGGVLVLLAFYFVVPAVQEKIFRRRYLNRRDGKAIEAAFARLRKQWDADPAVTARVLCGEMAEKLQCDTTPLMQGVEQAVYGQGCTTEMADAVFACYCQLRVAWKEWQKRLKKEAKKK